MAHHRVPAMLLFGLLLLAVGSRSAEAEEHKCIENDALVALATTAEQGGDDASTNQELTELLESLGETGTLTVDGRLLTRDDVTDLVGYCKDIVTWDVVAEVTEPVNLKPMGKAEKFPFNGVKDTTALILHNLLARDVYVQAYQNSSLLVTGEDDASASERAMRRQPECVSFHKYWGCVTMFPHCKQQRPDNAICAKVCREWNSRCRATEPELSCDTYPDSDCSAGAQSRVSWGLALLGSLVAALSAC